MWQRLSWAAGLSIDREGGVGLNAPSTAAQTSGVNSHGGAMTRISGAEALVRCLIEEGVQYVFGVPGDQCSAIADAIYRLGGDKGIKFITIRHEQAAAHMFDAWARVTGQPGVCLGTVGLGVADLVQGVYPASADSVPAKPSSPRMEGCDLGCEP